MPKPMHRSKSFKIVKRRTISGKRVIHYRRGKNAQPHCAICGQELNGISQHGGKSRRTNSRLFGGVLCASCTANVVKIRSRVESGNMRLDDIGVREKQYVLQLYPH
ncbi:MAG: 50S ribosomal protein L34e [Candidatus Marsarchaeota archaeon]|nr:50S ribosomal protein L34e [Candidatus Marsarchaeota archaeon]